MSSDKFLLKFIQEISKIISRENINIEYEVTNLLVNITESKYGYFNNIILKDGEYFNEGLVMIDKYNKVDKELLQNFKDSLFALNEKTKNEIWSQNYFNKKECSYINLERINRKCPIKDFKYYVVIPLNYLGKPVGCIALAGDTDYKKYKNLYNLGEIIASIIWSRRNIKNINELDKLKERNFYISQISHELKTPLNSILGFSQLLREEDDNKNVKEYTKYIIDNGERLLKLINGVLNINRLDYFKVEKKQINLKRFIDMKIKKYINREDLKKNIKIDEKYNVVYDENLLYNLFANLFTNINKYTTKDGVVNIYIKIINSKLWVYLENSGEIKLKKDIFEPFNKNNDNNGGSGLGLSIIKKIVDLHNEKIIFTQLNNLVQFRLSFNYIEFKYKMRFVYLEDNKFNQLLMKNIIKNHKLDIKDNAHDFLEYIRNYDFLLLDWHLNTVNGRDVLEILIKNNIHIPVIVITADTNPIVLKRLNDKGIKYFNKPINILEFKNYFQQYYSVKI